jgi:8-oxo-dGTP pyrophosphatase MutT (NUDIX family)
LSFTLPLGVILPVDEIDVRLDPAQHPFEVGREDAIAENWQREIAAKPALFDGTVVLLSEFGYDGGRLYGRCHAIRMAAHTVNAGRVYFAAGSFEPEDFPGGVVDAHGNMVREVREETGLDISGARRGTHHYVLATERGTVIFRRYFLDETADGIASCIRDFIAGESEPEIEEPVIIRHARDLPDGLMPHMPPMIDWHFSRRAD